MGNGDVNIVCVCVRRACVRVCVRERVLREPALCALPQPNSIGLLTSSPPGRLWTSSLQSGGPGSPAVQASSAHVYHSEAVSAG